MSFEREDLGACSNCPNYNCFGAHGKSPEGGILISCKKEKGLIRPQTAVDNHHTCSLFKRVAALISEAA